MIIKGETPNGFKYEYDNKKLANWEMMDWLTEIMEISEKSDNDRTDEDAVLMMRDMYAVIRRIFTRAQITAWKNTNRDENGEVVSDLMWSDFNSMFIANEEDKETKN